MVFSQKNQRGGGIVIRKSNIELNIGDKIERWTIIDFANSKIQPSGQVKKYYLCRCECGNIKGVAAQSLRNGRSNSCGCLSREMTSLRFKSENIYKITDNYVIGVTRNTQEEFFFDIDDYKKVKDFTWISYNGYITTNNYILDNYPKTMKLHRLVMNETNPKKAIDHINHNKLDNRKINLRSVSYSQNAMNHSVNKNNRSGVTGVHCSQNKWIAKIGLNNEAITLGTFDSKEEAISVRKEAEEKYYGEYSYDNSQIIGNTYSQITI